jgi:antitoxin (DNA-binding transcriptional repressor) of toxin-antitoxin stability system
VKSVGIRELKDKLSAYVREVQAGEVVQVTDHGHVVAELRPPGEVEERDLTPAQVRHRELVARGIVRPAREKRTLKFTEMASLRLPRGTAQRILDAERGE